MTPRLVDLGALTPRAFRLSCFPVKIPRESASAGWCRAVAIFGLED